MKRFGLYLLFCCWFMALGSCQRELSGEEAGGVAETYTVQLRFRNMVDSDSLRLGTVYSNDFGEDYSVSQLKYYICKVAFTGTGGASTADENYFLVDAASSASQSFTVSTGKANAQQLVFLLGVDSLRNTSGAQTGALDPLNGMIWDWNTGYIVFKLEGKSPSSTGFNNEITYHIGGFKDAFKTQREIRLNLPSAITLKKGKTPTIVLEANINLLFSGVNGLQISSNNNCTSPGQLAAKYADNLAQIFTIKQVIE